jgi:glycosyltransferase involved in cell wall biosynthesis
MKTGKPHYIVIISAVPFPYGNASDNAIYTFMDGFQEQGYEGEVVCVFPNMPSAHSNEPSNGTYKGVKYRYLHGKVSRSSSKLMSIVDNRILSKIYIKRISEQFHVTAVFITHTNEYFADIYRYCHKCDVKVVLTTCEYPEYIAKRYNKRLNKYRQLSKCIDKYIFETKTLQDYEIKALGREIDSIVIPATMPFDDIISCKRVDTKPYIAYCGSIHSDAKDGLSNIIRAFAGFHIDFPDIRLMFIGRISKQEYYNQLIQLVHELDLQEYITFVGEVDRKEYVQYLTNATMMMVAKPVDSYYGGGLSSKVIEYLFSGNPVLMTSSDDYVHYLTHKQNVYFVKDNNPDTLLNGLKEMFSNPEMMRQLGENGKKYAMESFNYHKLTKTLLDFILN